MGKEALRFGIYGGAGRRAATWILWTEIGTGRSEVYLTCREMGGFLKASMHESGQWHIAHSQNAFEEYVKGAIPEFEDQYIEKWPRPPDIAPGTTLAFRIVTPWSAVSTPITEDQFNQVIWLPNAPELKATEIAILFTNPATHVTGWPGRRAMSTSFIGSLPLENGEIVWAVYRIIDMPDFSSLGTGTGRFFKGKDEQDLKDLREGELRLLAFGTEPDGSRTIYDCVVEIQRDT